MVPYGMHISCMEVQAEIDQARTNSDKNCIAAYGHDPETSDVNDASDRSCWASGRKLDNSDEDRGSDDAPLLGGNYNAHIFPRRIF